MDQTTNPMTIVIVALLGIASLAAVIALGAIIYQLLFGRKKSGQVQESAKSTTPQN
jgi:hypothetical protein